MQRLLVTILFWLVPGAMFSIGLPANGLIDNFEPVVVLGSDTRDIQLDLNQLPFFEDTTASLTFENIVNKPFKRDPSFAQANYRTKSAYWVKLQIFRPDSVSANWIIEFYDQTIDRIDVYDISEGNFRKILLGDEVKFKQKKLKHKNFHVWLEEDKKVNNYTFYFRIESRTYADIRVAVRSSDQFINYALMEYYLYGLFYGMILIISIYNLLTFFAIKEIKYLYYTFYILSVGIYAMCVDGIAYQYLWSSWPEWNQIAYGVALYLLIFWAILFARRFLATQLRAPVIDKLLIYFLVTRTIWFFAVLIFNPQWFSVRVIEFIPLTLIFIASIKILNRGYKPARFFVMAYGFLFLGFIVKAMIYLAIIPHSTVAYYSLHIGFLLEMIFLTLSLSDRVRILKSNRDRALRRIISQHEQNAALREKVNKELEQKIVERTVSLTEKNRELERMNEKIEKQSKEISQINSLLDLENWKLKNNIKELLQDKVFRDDLTYEEFKEIFPTNDTCLKYIQKTKWGKGYKCKKCGNDKGHMEAHMSRRCTKCGYLESVTSNTVFHGIRFPIEKAFFILYVVRKQNEMYTLQELADLLDLRLNTVWGFKKKINSTSANKKKKMESKEEELDILTS